MVAARAVALLALAACASAPPPRRGWVPQTPICEMTIKLNRGAAAEPWIYVDEVGDGEADYGIHVDSAATWTLFQRSRSGRIDDRRATGSVDEHGRVAGLPGWIFAGARAVWREGPVSATVDRRLVPTFPDGSTLATLGRGIKRNGGKPSGRPVSGTGGLALTSSRPPLVDAERLRAAECRLARLERGRPGPKQLAEAHEDVGFLLAKLGRSARAVRAFARVVAIKDTELSRMKLARVLHDAGRYEDAIVQWRRAEEIRGKQEPWLEEGIALALRALGRVAEAVAIEKALRSEFLGMDYCRRAEDLSKVNECRLQGAASLYEAAQSHLLPGWPHGELGAIHFLSIVLAERRELLGEDHADTRATREALDRAYAAMGVAPPLPPTGGPSPRR